MATCSDLVTVLADATAARRPTVAEFARNLQKADLIRRGPRGLNALHMTLQEAATLLIGHSATVVIADAVEAAAAYQGLRCLRSDCEVAVTTALAEPDLAALLGTLTRPVKTQLGPAIEYLLAAAADGRLPRLMLALHLDATEGGDADRTRLRSMVSAIPTDAASREAAWSAVKAAGVRLRLEFGRPMPIAMLRVEQDAGLHHVPILQASFVTADMRVWKPVRGRVDVVQLDASVLRAVGEAIVGPHHGPTRAMAKR